MKEIQTLLLLIITAVATLTGEAVATLEQPYEVAWIRQLGTSAEEKCWDVSADGLGNAYIVGYTFGSLGGPNLGGGDAFLSKYDSAGNLLWTRQVGTIGDDSGRGVSADGHGNVYISGWTPGSLGGPNLGGGDAFLSKYDSAGNLLWTSQLGTSAADYGFGVAADSLGNVYISGTTAGSLGGPNAGQQDAYVSKYDSAGNLLWTSQFGTGDIDLSIDVSSDDLGNAYITGYIWSEPPPYEGEHDAFLSKYDALGNLIWYHRIGTEAGVTASGFGVSADGQGNVYMSGSRSGAFVSKYDSAGSLLWSRHLATNHSDVFGYPSASTDELGNVYVTGTTNRSLVGPHAGGWDVYVSKYDSAGNFLWAQQFGTGELEDCWGVSADGLGNLYIAGYTGGSLGGLNAGEYDAFLVKLVPEPSTVVLLGLGGLALLRKRKR